MNLPDTPQSKTILLIESSKVVLFEDLAGTSETL